MKKISYKTGLVGIIAFLLTAFQITSAQKARITGSVKDANGFPLQGASVFLNDNKTGSITDSTGRYELSVSPGQYIIASSFVGYSKQEINIHVGPDEEIEQNFTTSEDYKECTEVVVVCSPASNSKLQGVKPLFNNEINVRGFKKISGRMQALNSGKKILPQSGK